MTKPLTSSDFNALANQLERCARVLRTKGPEALRRAKDWATPLRSAGTDPGRGKGNVSDPTANAATSDFRDPNAEELTLLTVEAGHAFDAAVYLESRVLRIATDAVIENQRAGIGYCECGAYMDGTQYRRLRNGQCPACDARQRRSRGKPTDCSHPKQHWSKGVIRCVDCEAELTDAGVAVLNRVAT